MYWSVRGMRRTRGPLSRVVQRNTLELKRRIERREEGLDVLLGEEHAPCWKGSVTEQIGLATARMHVICLVGYPQFRLRLVGRLVVISSKMTLSLPPATTADHAFAQKTSMEGKEMRILQKTQVYSTGQTSVGMGCSDEKRLAHAVQQPQAEIGLTGAYRMTELLESDQKKRRACWKLTTTQMPEWSEQQMQTMTKRSFRQ
mmetsp:Transcript_50114/g.83193  ORF Transcript_50114/g.83193 Transcript_50114/m.83193 type:complete len:201 (-) Transcript_50114:888-1490(-)